MNWVELFSSTGYDLPLEVQPGSRFEGGEGYPDARVITSDLLYPRRMLVQRMDVLAERDERREKIRIYRIAVETEDGDVVEIKRLAVPHDGESLVNVTKCAGCGGEIPTGQHVVVDGLAYHRRCVEEGSDAEADSIRRGARLRGGAGAGDPGDREEGQPEEDRPGVPPTVAPTTVTKTRSEDGVSVSHLVTVVKLDDDRDMVTLWAREFDGTSGTVEGRWPTGLFQGDLPKQSDAEYVDHRFFKGAGIVTTSDLRVWNRLYKEAIRELRPNTGRSRKG